MQTTSRQHAKMFLDLIERGIHGDQLVIYTLIHDRMQSSVTRDAFYDKQLHRHYVIYTVKELSDFIGISERTVGKLIKELVDNGLLKIKKQFSKANKIFIPDFDEEDKLKELAQRNKYNAIDEDSSVPYPKNVPTNQTNFKQTNKQNNTKINTKNGQKTSESPSFESWIESTSNGYSMDRSIPETVAKYSQHFDNPKDVAYRVVGTISRVRGFIAKKFGIKKTELSQFDSNANFGAKLADKVKSVMIHAINKKITDIGQLLAYLNKSLQNFFTQATGKGFKTAQPAFAPEMSTASSRTRYQNNGANKQAVQPQWMIDEQAGIEREVERPTVFDSLKIKAKLLYFKDGIDRDYENLIYPKINDLMAKFGIGMNDKTPEDAESELAKNIVIIEQAIAKM